MLLKYLPKEKIVEIPDNLKELTEQLVSAVMNLDIQMEHEIAKKLREEMTTTQGLSARECFRWLFMK